MTATTILVIDDHEDVAFSVELATRDWPERVTVLAAVHGTAAVRLFHRHRDQIVLVVLDYQMPGIDGWDTCTLLRSLSPSVPILPYTGTVDPLPHLHDLGCLPVLTKQATALNPALLGHKLYEALHSPVPPVTIPAATLARVQALVAEKAAASAAVVRSSDDGVIIVGAVGVRRQGLKDLVRRTESVQVLLATSQPEKCRLLHDARSPVALVGTPDDLGLLRRAQTETALPIVLVAATFTDALIHRDDPSIAAIVIEHPTEATVASLMFSLAMRAIAEQQSYRPEVLIYACADTTLTPVDRDILPAELAGTDTATLAAQRGVSYGAQKRARTRLYDHLFLAPDRAQLRAWVEEWWASHPILAAPGTH